MEPEVSLLCLQEPRTGPCSESVKSIPLPQILVLRPILILSSRLRLVSSSNAASLFFPSDNLYELLGAVSVFLCTSQYLNVHVRVSNICSVIDCLDLGFTRSVEKNSRMTF